MADTNGDILNCHQGLYELQGYGCLGIRRLVRENMHGNQLNSTGKNGIEGMADTTNHELDRRRVSCCRCSDRGSVGQR